jgi:hypothetical protein
MTEWFNQVREAKWLNGYYFVTFPRDVQRAALYKNLLIMLFYRHVGGYKRCCQEYGTKPANTKYLSDPYFNERS